jgi:hypothetical protein
LTGASLSLYAFTFNFPMVSASTVRYTYGEGRTMQPRLAQEGSREARLSWFCWTVRPSLIERRRFRSASDIVSLRQDRHA